MKILSSLNELLPRPGPNMAELVGVVASIVGLAGAAATVSFTLIDCAHTLKYGQAELKDLATDVRDLGIVLEFLSDVLSCDKGSVSDRVRESSSHDMKYERLIVGP